VVQLGWIASLLFVPRSWSPAAFLILAAAELAVPVWAEWRTPTRWHPGHIAERYSLFVIILLGEGVAAATGAMQRALAVSGITPQLIAVGLAGLVVLFAIWWLYFLEPAARGLRERPRWSYFWGYGHYFLFAAIAAIGAGLEVAVEQTGHEAHGGGIVAGYAVAIPVAAVFVLLYVLHRPLVDQPEVPARVVLPAAVATLLLPLAIPAFGVAAMVVALAVLSALVVAVTLALHRD
jgi:low temperature requirement protein LtrA